MKICSNKNHSSYGSQYPKDSVPELSFRNGKNPEKPFSTCLDCREYSKNTYKRKKDRIEIKKKNCDDNFRVCTYASHNTISEYPYDKVPVKLFLKDSEDPEYGEFKTCIDCRNEISERKNKILEKIKEETPEEGFTICTYPHHTSVSKYPANSVPVEKFLKNTQDITDMYKHCDDCRNYNTGGKNKRNAEQREISEAYVENFKKGETKFLYCPCAHHNIKNVSIYSREQVPVEMFQKYSDDFEDFFDNCSDCRAYAAIHGSISVENKKLSAKPGEFYCEGCKNYKNESERGIKTDGSPSKNRCSNCKIKEKNRKQSMKQTFQSILYESFLNIGSCCERCNSIFLKPSEGTFFAVKLKTYKVGGGIYVNYEGKKYSTKDFLIKYREILEYRIIEMDHLTELEQRQRGILKSDQEYEPKISQVSSCGSEKSMRRESKKCQTLCAICHVIQTIERYENIKEPNEKQEYINNMKLNCGCSVCGFKTEIARLLDMDHLNPLNKISCLSEMASNSKFNLQDIIEECKKCRVLCRHCHKIHTDEQRKSGVFDNIHQIRKNQETFN